MVGSNMRRFVGLFLVLLATGSIATVNCDAPNCLEGWKSFQNNCYYFGESEEGLSWLDAQASCLERKSNLTSILSDEENFFILGIKGGVRERFWIGLRAEGFRSSFEWEDGEIFDYNMWEDEQPREINHETCIAALQNGQWDSVKCTEPLKNYVCKIGSKSEEPTKPTILTGGCKDDWLKFEGKCYWMLGPSQGKNFKDAQKHCESFGKNNSLVSIHSRKEMDYLTSLVGALNSSAWIGLKRKYAFSKKHEWNDKSDVNFQNWARGEPSTKHISASKTCVQMNTLTNRAGEWMELSCDTTLAYICQAPPDPKLPGPKIYHNCQHDDFVRYRKACYKFEAGKLNFFDAGTKCRTDYSGYLLSVTDYFEQAYINVFSSHIEHDNWIGLSDVDDKLSGSFSWTDHWPVYFTFWAKDQPREDGHKRCVVKTHQDTWETRDCTDKHSFICKVNDELPPQLPEVNLQKCPNNSKNWIDENTDSCYQFFPDDPQTWDQALAKCRDLNGTLAGIHSQHELDILRKHVVLYESLWIGLFSSKDGVYEWSDGRALNLAPWSSSRNATAGGCVDLLVHEMTFNNTDCLRKEGYICYTPKAPASVLLTTPGIASTTSIISTTKTIVVVTGKPNNPVTTNPNIIVPQTTAKVEGTREAPLCQSLWSHHNGYCYYNGGSPYSGIDFFQAQDKCFSQGSHLVSIHSQDELDFLAQLVKDTYGSDHLNWVGLNAIGKTSFEWSDGTPADFIQLNDKDKIVKEMKCVRMDSLKKNSWALEHCGGRRGYICKKKVDETRSTITPLPTTPPPGYCPTGWSRLGNRCIKVFSTQVTWKKARELCKKNPTGDLVSIHSAKEQALVQLLLSKESQNAWIGMNKVDYNIVGWSDETRTDYKNWLAGQPSPITYNSECVEMISSGHNSGKWKDTYCDYDKNYICQRIPDKDSVSTAIPVSICKEGFAHFGSACFKIVADEQLSWNDAESKCQSLGGNMASIKGPSEQAFLQYTANDYSFSKGLWIGLKDTKPRVFQWSDKWPVYFTNWADWQPIHSDQTRCTYMNTQSLEWVASTGCDEQRGYVCKINLEQRPNVPDLHDGQCPDHAAKFLDFGTESCYFVETGEFIGYRKNQQAANHACLTLDATLASFHSQHELDVLGPSLKKAKSLLWIGLLKKHTGSFDWTDGSPFEFEQWAESPKGFYECGGINAITMKWSEQSCADNLGYICKIKKVVKTVSIETSAQTNKPSTTSVPTVFDNTTETLRDDEPSGTGLAGGSIAAIVLFTIFGVVAISGAVYYYIRRKRMDPAWKLL